MGHLLHMAQILLTAKHAQLPIGLAHEQEPITSNMKKKTLQFLFPRLMLLLI
jgi:hypothetical protein